MTGHGAYSLLAEIKPGQEQALSAVLDEIERTKDDTDGIIPFRKLTSIHFARFVILNERADTSGKVIPSRLAFTSNYDLPSTGHLQQLLAIGGKGLWQTLSFCADFPEGDYDVNKLKQYLLQKSLPSDTFYVGVGNRSVQQIQDESILHDAIEEYLTDNQSTLAGKDALAIREKIIEYINAAPALKKLAAPTPKPSLAWAIKHYGALVLFILIAIPLAILLLPVIIIAVLIILMQEIKDDPGNIEVTKDHLRELTSRETGMVQAQFSAVGNLKPGWVRLQTVLVLLRITNFLAPYLFSKGRLSGIPTVHFARWIIINGGKQMLFLSNYDGNSESYLTDFINIAAKPLTLMFSHTVGYPKTYLMTFGGAKDAKKFLAWARYNQTITNVWYTANPNVNVKNIFNNSSVKDGLFGTMTEQEAQKWLSRI